MQAWFKSMPPNRLAEPRQTPGSQCLGYGCGQGREPPSNQRNSRCPLRGGSRLHGLGRRDGLAVSSLDSIVP